MHYHWFAPGWDVGQPRGIRLRKAHVGWDWVTSDAPSWKIPRTHLSEFPASKDGWTKGMKEYCVVFLNKNVVFMPIGALSLKLNNIRYFSFNFEKRHSYKSSIRSKFTSYLNAFTRFCPMFIDLLVYSKCQIKWNSGQFWTFAQGRKLCFPGRQCD